LLLSLPCCTEIASISYSFIVENCHRSEREGSAFANVIWVDEREARRVKEEEMKRL
jgi:hypothetical protein